MQKTRTKFITLLLTLSIIGILPSLPAKAENNNLKSITLNPASLRPADGKWSKDTGNLLYFGTHVTHRTLDGQEVYGPLAYRVLAASPETQTTEKSCLLLDCNTGLATVEMAFSDSSVRQYPSHWPNCSLRKWLNGNEFLFKDGVSNIPGVFSELERNAIVTTGLKPLSDYSNLENKPFSLTDYTSLDRIFLLSAKEVQTLYSSADSRIKKLFFQSSSDSDGPGWWLRTTTSASVDSDAVIVNWIYGELYTTTVSYSEGKNVCPAFNVAMDSIAFVSSVETGKISSDIIPVSTTSAHHWKATLFDDSKKVYVPERLSVAREDVDGVTTIKVPYRYEGDHVTQISVMITDKAYTEQDAQVLYYGALQGVELEQAKIHGGIGTFTLPTQLPSSYHVYLFAEEINGAKETDYTSRPYEISLPKVDPETPDENPNTTPNESPDTTPGDSPEVPSNSAGTSQEVPNTVGISDNTTNAVNTGDNATAMYLFIYVLLSGSFIVFAVVSRKRRS